MKSFSTSSIKAVQKNLLAWFQKNQRPLPWRKTYNPYQVWISEIMLQQTQVKTVLPYFERWMKKLPTIQSVAEAKEDVVLKLWEGLGYYSRARNIQKAAKLITERFGGKFPQQYEDILNLPGVGKYTACAISSIAFNQNLPVVDGNVIRVISRLLNFHGNMKLPENIKWAWKQAEILLPHGQARHFNQAMMELGALICKPKIPHCFICPLKKNCGAFRAGTVEQLPNLGAPLSFKSIRVVLGVIRKNRQIFIQKRPSCGLMAGLWEFPGGKIEKGESIQNALEREIKEELGIRIKNIRPITKIKHGYTRFNVNLHCFSADYASGKIRLTAAQEGKWVETDELKNYAFPAANTKLIRLFL